jgi:hypothetical protein
MESEELAKSIEEAKGELTPFDRNVAMTMAMMAAGLALVTMLSHRAHTETLSLQAEANHLRTEANVYHTRATDEWGFYQAKNIRDSEYRGFLGMLGVLARAPGAAAAKQSSELAQHWSAEIQKYEKHDLPELKAQAEALTNKAHQLEEESARAIARSYHAHRQGGRFDLAELGFELALVICSLAVLTKLPPFWYSGIAIGLVGAAVAVSAWLMG